MALLGRWCGVLVACALASACLDPDFALRGKNKDFLVIGHRGAPWEEAENTIASMEAAAGLGANAIETDLCITLDGAVVLWHDLDPDDTLALARQVGLEGFPWTPFVPPAGSPLRRPIDELLLSDLLDSHGYSRDLGLSRDRDAPIALLDDLLGWAARENDLRTVYLDVKVAEPEQAAEILRAVVDGAPRRDVSLVFLSPRRRVVEALVDERARLGAADVRIAWDFDADGALEGAEELGLRDACTGLTETRVETLFLDEVEDLVEARRDGRIDTVTVWTIDKRQLLGQLLFRDVDGIMTNRPEVLFELWQLTL